MRAARLLFSTAVGIAFFLAPIPGKGRLTILFDVVVQWIVGTAPEVVGVYCWLLVLFGAVATLVAFRHEFPTEHPLARFRCGAPLALLRLGGAVLASAFFFQRGPSRLLDPDVSGLMWSTLAFSVGVIIPLGAGFLLLFARYGFLELVGTLMRPVMRPLFRLPGRSALDSVTSWVGSYSVGLYLTRRLFLDGYYSRREAYTIVTCFSTVSVGFVAVIAQTLGLLRLFPLIVLAYGIAVYVLTAVLARTWPVRGVPDTYLGTPRPEPSSPTMPSALLRTAWRRALDRSGESASLAKTVGEGLVDGLGLAASILGSILAVGTAALLLARETPFFTLVGKPLVPILTLLGLPDAELVAPATLAGISEMYIPALLAREASEPARFFVAVLSVSQLVFFSAVGPMILDMFREIPVRARELLGLFLLRTVLLVPPLALLTKLLELAGVLS